MPTLTGQNSFNPIPQNSLAAGLRLPTALGSASEHGLLEISILSVYDLPFSEQPTAVSLSTCGMTVTTGPPVARHKDKNSFRFSATPTSTIATSSTANNNSKHELKLAAPLPELYKAKVSIRVLYDENPNQTLQAEYSLQQLKIHESTWLILTLGDPDAPSPSTSTGSSSPPNADDDAQPTIRVKLHLTGPYRPEIAALVGLGKGWLELMDHVETNVQQIVQKLPPMPDKKYVLIPAVPVVTAVVVAAPVVAGVLVVGLPFLLPIILLSAILGASVVGAGGFLYASSKAGRSHVGGVFGPYYEGMVSSRAGQKLVYNTGPRPTPVSVARQIVPTTMWSKLMFCLLLDLIGSSSYLIPLVGEGFDLAWAPLQTILIMAMYDGVAPHLKYLSFMEEILPFTDIVPSATIGWAVEFGPQLIDTTLHHMPPEMTSLARTAAPAL